MYLFQVINDNTIKNSFVGGNSLAEQEEFFIRTVR